MADGDGAAVDIDLGHIELQIAGHGHGLGGEGLVGLDQVDVLDGQVGLGQSLTGSGDGAQAHDLGIHAALAPADQLGHGLQAVLLNSLLGSQHQSGGAVVDAGSIGGGHAAALGTVGQGEGTLQLGDGLHGHAGLGILVHLELDHFLLLLHHDGNDLSLELAGGLSGLGLVLGVDGELVQLLTGDAVLVADVLSGGAHVVVVVDIPQTVVHHGVDDLVVAHAGAPAGSGDGVGSGRHILGTAGHDDVGITGHDGAGSLDHGLHAGAAHHGNGVGGDLDGHTGLQGDLTGGVLAQTGRQDAAEHDLVNILGLDTGAVQGLLDDNSAELNGGGVLQGAAKRTDSGAAAVDNIDFSHDT